MTDNINPSHYKDGPFECINLSRLLSSDWGQAVQYCFRWQHKNGVEDLKKAAWFINDALDHNVPFVAAWSRRNSDMREVQSAYFLEILHKADWAGLGVFWQDLEFSDFEDALKTLNDKIAEIEKEGK